MLLDYSPWIPFVLYPNLEAGVMPPMKHSGERRKLLNTQKFITLGFFFSLFGNSWSHSKCYGDTQELVKVGGVSENCFLTRLSSFSQCLYLKYADPQLICEMSYPLSQGLLFKWPF